jgi:hypothetical protein
MKPQLEPKTGIWERVFSDNLFEGVRPNKDQRKKMYDKCYRKSRRKFKKEFERNPSKAEFSEELEDCLRDQLYRYQLQPEKPRKNVGTAFETGRINRQKEERELAEDVRRLNRINRDFFSTDREEREEAKKAEDKRLKKWIEEKVRGESGYYD